MIARGNIDHKMIVKTSQLDFKKLIAYLAPVKSIFAHALVAKRVNITNFSTNLMLGNIPAQSNLNDEYFILSLSTSQFELKY